MAVRDFPLVTDVHDNVNAFTPEKGSAYVFGTSVEQRSAHSQEWESRAKDVLFVRIDEVPGDEINTVVGSDSIRVPLRSRAAQGDLWAKVGRKSIYLDITGLSHHVWAPLLRSALDAALDVKAVYVEPQDYRFSQTPTEGEIFDLSEKIEGIAPLPGFAFLSEARDEDVCFVPLLGFEGARFAYALEHVQPPGQKVYPVIGVPGFRPEYAFHAYQGNKAPLLESRSWKNVRLAMANCPFSLYYVLRELSSEHPNDRVQIAPIGTKPHALGAVLFALSSPDPVELVYDHPIRKAARSVGTDKLLVYHLSAFARGF